MLEIIECEMLINRVRFNIQKQTLRKWFIQRSRQR